MGEIFLDLELHSTSDAGGPKDCILINHAYFTGKVLFWFLVLINPCLFLAR